MQKHFRGDIGLFRAALKRAGFVANGMMFNDDSKANPKKPTRRLKMWFADTVFEAPQYRQEALAACLHSVFGERITKMEFIAGGRGLQSGRAGLWKSLTIHLIDRV